MPGARGQWREKVKIIINLGLVVAFVLSAVSAKAYEHDRIATKAGPLDITFIKHASLMFRFQDKIIYVDPVAKMGDYSRLPPAGRTPWS